jgi:hypothetical protein
VWKKFQLTIPVWTVPARASETAADRCDRKADRGFKASTACLRQAQTERASGFASNVKRGISSDAERRAGFDGRREITDFAAAERCCTDPIANLAPA